MDKEKWYTKKLLLISTLILYTSISREMQGIQAEKDIENMLQVLGSTDVSKPDLDQQPVVVMWGLADTTATIGKLFQYTLQKEAFKGKVTSYEVTESGEDKLPLWLEYDPKTRTLFGVPGADQLGKSYHILVTALGQFNPDTISKAKDIFTIDVLNDKINIQDTAAVPLKEANINGLKPVRCPEGSSVTMVSIIIDTDMSILKPANKVGLLKDLCTHLNIPPELVRLLPVGSKPMFDSSALVAGPGDVKKPLYSGAVVQWEVGCGNVYANHMPVLQQVETTSGDGTMSRSLGYGVIGWHVTNNKFHVPRRMKRQVSYQATATLVPTLGPPSHQPVPTVVIDESDQPITRAVPTMASPSFTGEIVPSKTKHHKHHHRTKTRGRHQHKTKHPKHSPTHKHHHKTMLPKTVMPTATMLPIQPTRVIDITPTIIDTAVIRPVPSYDVASPGISRTDTLLEPSVVPEVPRELTKATEILPSRTYVIPDIMTTEPIEPSRTDVAVTPFTIAPPTKKPPKQTRPTLPVISTEEPFNYAPILKNDISRIVVNVGDILFYKVPKDTFYDFEDGNTENLELVFLTVDGLTLPRNSWVNFNLSSQTLYGLPLAEHVGRSEYLMAAIDSKGKIARDAFEIVVQRRPHETKINHEFSLKLDLDYNKFISDVKQRIDVAKKIASVFGDKNTSNIRVIRIEEGSVIYAWTNTSIQYEPCPIRDLQELLGKMIADNDTITQNMIQKMKPYRVMRVGSEPHGPCSRDVPTVTTGPKSTDPEAVETPHETSHEEKLITTVVPAVIIAAMLLISGLIACMVYRKKRKGKLSDEDHHTFINKGIPIIFADELDDKPDPPTKPLILDEEKPPLPPPEYPRSSASSTPSTPGSEKKEPFDTEDDQDTDMTSPLYQPPPPFTGSREHRHARPRVQPAYRNPPPYVPP